MKTTLTLNFQELQALHYFLSEVITRAGRDHSTSLYVQLQLELLGELLVEKVHPKSLVNTGKPIRLKLKRSQVIAYQLAVMQGWAGFCADVYTQNVIRRISMEELPRVVVSSARQLQVPDGWG